MELALLLFNFLLIFMYTVPFTLAMLCWLSDRRPIYLYSGLLFFFYLLTDILVRMTETISWFAEFYNTTIMSVPTIRTLLFAGYMFCLIQICIDMVDSRHKTIFYGIFIIMLCIMMLLPMLPDSATKSFFYYTPVQVFTFILSIYGLRQLPKVQNDYPMDMRRKYRLFLLCTAILSVLITAEDFFVIYHIDIYTEVSTFIVNRSVTEDLMSICHSILITSFLLPMLLEKLKDITLITDADAAHASPAEASAEPEPPKTLAEMHESVKQKAAERPPEPTEASEDFSKFYLFCKEYMLTTREQDILRLLLENKNNVEISDELYISVGTAKAHIHNIYTKLDIKKRYELLEIYRKYNENTENKAH